MTRHVVPRKRKQLLTRRQELRILSLVLIVVALPTMGAVFAITFSSRPSLERRTFAQDDFPGKSLLVDSPTLDRLYKREPTSTDEIHRVLSQDVRLPGYMISYDQLPDKEGKVARFLLVPCGHWLHPPHRFDVSKVMVVLLREGLRTPFIERSVFVVTGRLSFERTNNDRAESGFVLQGTGVDSGGTLKFRN